MIIDSPSKTSVDVTLPFPVMNEMTEIQKSGDNQTGNFYMKLADDEESSSHLLFPPAVICHLGERLYYEKVMVYDNTGRICYL